MQSAPNVVTAAWIKMHWGWGNAVQSAASHRLLLPFLLWHWLQPSPGAGMECSSAVLLSGVDTAIATCCAKFSITQANKAANPWGWPCFPRRLCSFVGTRAAAGCISLSPAAHCLGFCLYAPGALTISPFLAWPGQCSVPPAEPSLCATPRSCRGLAQQHSMGLALVQVHPCALCEG